MQVESGQFTPLVPSSRRMTQLTAFAVLVLGGGAGALLLPGALHGRLSPLFLALPLLTLAPAPLFSLSHERSEDLNQQLTAPLDLTPTCRVEGEFAQKCRVALIHLGKIPLHGFQKEEIPGIDESPSFSGKEANELLEKLGSKFKFPENGEYNLAYILNMAP